MRKNFGAKEMCYPMPVYIIGTYGTDGTPNAMNAAWGGISEEDEILFVTVDGKVIYDVKPGTQTDTRVRLKGKGVPTRRNAEVRGDHYVTLVVQVPDKMSHEAKELLKKFDAECGDTLNAAKKVTSKEEPEKPDNGGGNKKKKFWK